MDALPKLDLTPYASGPGWELYLGDMREVAARLPGKSVDAVITDPPWSREHVECFAWLGIVARHVLKPEGVLLTLSGHHTVAGAVRLISPHVPFRWLMVVVSRGPAPRVWPLRVVTMFQPVLLFTARGCFSGPFRPDLIDSTAMGPKGLHPWAQGLSGFFQLVRYWTEEGDVILDPFAGTGTTGLAAILQNRRFIGIEKDARTAEIAARRLSNLPPRPDVRMLL